MLIPNNLEKKLSHVLALHVDNTLNTHLSSQFEENLKCQFEALLTYYTTKLLTHSEQLGSKLDYCNLQQCEMHESWILHLITLWQEQALAVDQQRISLDDQRIKMEALLDSGTQDMLVFEPLIKFGKWIEKWIEMSNTRFLWLLYYGIIWLLYLVYG
jgi:hypothetical protein